MYGTVMIAKLREGATAEDLMLTFKNWRAEVPDVEGFVDERVLLADDGRTIVTPVRFASESAYKALADDPRQDEFWRTRIAPHFEGDVQWIDGHWVGETTA